MRITLLGSGSSGNVAYFEAADGRTRVLVDAGLPKAEVEERLRKVPGLSASDPLAQIDAVLVTHDHNDHAAHARAYGRPIWATAGTRRACELEAGLVRAGDHFLVGDFGITPVLLPHDAVETVGYVLQDREGRAGILTDCGHDAPDVALAYAGCDLLILETNHDAGMLQKGSYPPSLKRRVGGRLGHLSNDQAASLLKQMCQHAAPPKVVVAAHLSQANNRPQLAKSALDRVLGRGGRVVVATQDRGSPLFSIRDERVAYEAERNMQLTFDFARAGAAS